MQPFLKTPWVKNMAAQTDFYDFENLSESIIEQFQNDGLDELTAAAYFQIAPLLLEASAITNWINDSGNLHFRYALPEVLNIEEAAHLAIEDYRLNNVQTNAFVTKLNQEVFNGF